MACLAPPLECELSGTWGFLSLLLCLLLGPDCAWRTVCSVNIPAGDCVVTTQSCLGEQGSVFVLVFASQITPRISGLKQSPCYFLPLCETDLSRPQPGWLISAALGLSLCLSEDRGQGWGWLGPGQYRLGLCVVATGWWLSPLVLLHLKPPRASLGLRHTWASQTSRGAFPKDKLVCKAVGPFLVSCLLMPCWLEQVSWPSPNSRGKCPHKRTDIGRGGSWGGSPHTVCHWPCHRTNLLALHLCLSTLQWQDFR